MSCKTYLLADGRTISVVVRVYTNGASDCDAERIALAAAVRALEGQQRKPEPWDDFREYCSCRYYSLQNREVCAFYDAVGVDPCLKHTCPRLRSAP
jgi:hypothetical protein